MDSRAVSGGEPEAPGGAPDEFWAVEPAALCSALDASPRGLPAPEARRRLALHGPNRLVPPRRHATLALLWSQFRSPISLLLLAAASLSFVLHETTDAAIIIAIILASGLLGFWQERRASIAVQALLAMVQTHVTVLRDGAPAPVPPDDVVPGDVVLLVAGDSTPGDARILDSKDLYVDESALTGESYPAEKAAGAVPAEAPLARRTNALFAGTHVVNGSATALVVATGARTVLGGISRRLAQHPAETEFERGIRRFGYGLLEVAAVMALGIFAVNVALDRPVLDSLLFTLALTVGLTPQLLPAIVSITLAQGARHMARERVIVRRLTSIEDIGEITVLCTDKTGTLTRGVVSIESALDAAGAESDKVARYAWLNASLQTGFPNPIDEAIRGHDAARVAAPHTKIDEVPYDFLRKRLSVLVEMEGERLMITKGALAAVLAVCARAEAPGGTTVPIAEVRDAVLGRHEALSREGYRCLGVACRVMNGEAVITKESEHDLVFLGILALFDPPKPDALESLRRLEALGISTKMITGDSAGVAATVARETGLDGGAMLTGSEVRRLTDSALVQQVPRIHVFAEMEPNQKERVVLALKKAGYAVGFLGDGINDAPSLHAADVGISVDTAADVTKQAADIVLLEKDLGVLADGVREGRRAFNNTLKYVFITISANFGNMFSMAGASLFTSFLPLLPKQILLLNLLSDLPAMAIAADRVDRELVARPRRWDMRAIQRFMITFGLLSSVFDFLTFGALLLLDAAAPVFRAGWFLESLLSEILILLVIRTRRPFFRSVPGRALLAASLAVAAVGLAVPWLPGADVLGFAPVPPTVLFAVAVILAGYVASSEIAKRTFFRLSYNHG
jgi:Mg2+-importing ATPase